jgi:hypothetical protein
MTDHIEQHESGGVARSYWQDADCPTSTQVIQCVAAASKTAPQRLPPLHETIDPDALDMLFPAGGPGSCCLAFRFAETEIYLSGDGDLQVIATG